MTKHLTGRKTPPNFRLTLACLAFPIAAGDSDTCLGLGRLIGAGVWGQQKVCVQMEGPLGIQSYIPKRGGRGQGSKPQLTPLPALCLGTYRDPEWSTPLVGRIMQFVQLMQQLGWQGRLCL